MKLCFKPFDLYVNSYTSKATRERSVQCAVKNLDLSENIIKAKVLGSRLYDVQIKYNERKVKSSNCSCDFLLGPVCKHVVKLLEVADQELEKQNLYTSYFEQLKIDNNEDQFHVFEYTFKDFDFEKLTNTFIYKNASKQPDDYRRGYFDIYPVSIGVNEGVFKDTYTFFKTESVRVKYKNRDLTLSCKCNQRKDKLCEHQVQVLFNLKDRVNLRVFFDTKLREKTLREFAVDYGLENVIKINDYFNLGYKNDELVISSVNKEIIPVTKEDNLKIKNALKVPSSEIIFDKTDSQENKFLVISKHKYYDSVVIELYSSGLTKDGAIKNPLNKLVPIDLMWKTKDADQIRFYAGLTKLQNSHMDNFSDKDVQIVKEIILNPINYTFYIHDSSKSENIKANSITKCKLSILKTDVVLDVTLKDDFYEVTAFILNNDEKIAINNIKLLFSSFVKFKEDVFFVENIHYMKVIEFFKRNNQVLVIHASKYETFQEEVLLPLEDKLKINYTYFKKPSKKLLQEFRLTKNIQKKVYLSDAEDYIQIVPVVDYNQIEVPILSKKQIYTQDAKGNSYLIDRDEKLELGFLSVLLRQHSDFEEQLNLDSFYIHRNQFLEEGWFFDVFETWRSIDVEIFGFSQLKNNRYNPHKANVTVGLSSGLDWFETSVKLSYGNQEVDLKQLQKALKNHAKFVALSDGTMGMLPEEWIEKFSKYFRSGELHKNTIRTPKVNFSEVNELFEVEQIDEKTNNEIKEYKSKFLDFEKIENCKVPTSLNAELRDYQKQGLNWLNFLDDFGFGGCLADDMGLGKTIQIIAFILSQREKRKFNTNLIVVPTSLIFNWVKEIEKFAPSINYKVLYGNDRIKNTKGFDQYEIVLTSYGTLLSDIYYLKEYRFNYIFLDESQAIKNPSSQRYKSVRLLHSRNKIVLTGTPVENNTFDLYGQFSFACPGLLGNMTYFKEVYAIPIDKFKDTVRARELQIKVNPFLLRRTKKQVAKELPEKTEMVIYCEMGEEQRRVYDAYKEEFRAFLLASKNKRKNMDTMYVLAGLTKLRQICNSPALLNEESYYGDDSAKLDVLLEEIKSKAPYHKMIVFSQFVGMLELVKDRLENEGISFEYLTGQTKNREERVENFQSNNEIRVFLISLKAGGTGLNLTEADYVYLVDPWWNPSVENQAIDRCYRIGQKKNVVAVRLISPNTIEDKIIQLQDSKKDLVSDIIKTDESILKSIDKENLLSLFD